MFIQGGLVRARQTWSPSQHKSSFIHLPFLAEVSQSVTGKLGDRYSTCAKTLAGMAQNGRWFWKYFLCGRRTIWWTWTTFWKGRKFRKSRFVKRSSFLISDMMMIACGRCGTSDALCSFFVAGAIINQFVDLCQKSAQKPICKSSLLTFSMFVFRGERIFF